MSIAVMGGGGSIIAATGAGNSHESFALMAGVTGLLCLVPLRLFLRRSHIALAV